MNRLTATTLLNSASEPKCGHPLLKTFQPTAISKPFRYAQYLTAAGLALSLAFGAAQGLKAAADSGLERTYPPIQAISHVLGSTRAIGHVLQNDRSRDLVPTVAEAADPEVATSTTAPRQCLTPAAGVNARDEQRRGPIHRHDLWPQGRDPEHTQGEPDRGDALGLVPPTARSRVIA